MTLYPANDYRVALTSDAVRPDGSSIHGDLGLDRLTAGGVDWFVLPPGDPRPVDLAGVPALISFGHAHVDEEFLAEVPELRHVARFGAGYDTVDLEACTRAGVLVTNTPDGVRKPLAVAGLTLLLAVATNLLGKDAMTRTGDWSGREHLRGAPLEGSTVGIVGFGGVGAELATMLKPLGVNLLAVNRRGSHPRAAELGAEFTDLTDLLQRSDYVVLTASLTPQTRRMIDAVALTTMKPTAYLVNIGRGGLVDTDALREALRTGVIAGAGLDVFDPEPLPADDELLSFENVVLSPHALCWTADFTRDVSTSVVEAVLDVAAGRTPRHLLNPGALVA